MDIKQAKEIMGKNFIGPEELKRISFKLGIKDPFKIGRPIPNLLFSSKLLKKINKDYLLILGIPVTKDGRKLTINKMRSIFGWNSAKKEPCFYNQDWYLKEKFANNKTLDFKWYLIRKNIRNDSRGRNPETLIKILKNRENFPSAILTVFTFFSYYFLTNGKILWKHDFIWCSDKDINDDRIYTGRYMDPQKVNKNGFNIHRYLSIRFCYGLVPQIL